MPERVRLGVHVCLLVCLHTRTVHTVCRNRGPVLALANVLSFTHALIKLVFPCVHPATDMHRCLLRAALAAPNQYQQAAGAMTASLTPGMPATLSLGPENPTVDMTSAANSLSSFGLSVSARLASVIFSLCRVRVLCLRLCLHAPCVRRHLSSIQHLPYVDPPSFLSKPRPTQHLPFYSHLSVCRPPSCIPPPTFPCVHRGRQLGTRQHRRR